ncbi:PHP domain-containing protein [Actinomycetaceae bacterium MB13-C1-2]|nr:PHP domain-containing protein [Actinomycetaceae bacterium MB13-C1-2]
MIRIDPHAHTIHSDGTDTPSGLIGAAKDAGLDYVGISDHDTTAGWNEAITAAKKAGVGLIPGVEFSAQWQGRPVHVLGLLVDPTYEPLQREFLDAQKSRSQRLARMVAKMLDDFPGLTWENVEARANGAPLGRPHLADELVELGYVPNRSEAFKVILNPAGPYWERQRTLPPREAVELIRSAGGVPILAHPQATRRGRPVPQEVVQEMVEAGLFGLERDHRDHDEDDRAEVERLAEHFGLPVTGGSDYHGLGKPNRLGENLTDEEVFEQIRSQGAIGVIEP